MIRRVFCIKVCKRTSIASVSRRFFGSPTLFLDNYFPPYIPNELFKSRGWSLSDLVNVYMPDETSDQPAVVYSKLPFKIYPSLLGFTIFVIVAALMIPIIGFCIGSYRCCCKSKVDPYDRRADSFLRKFNSVLMFIILTAILLTTITLFFTNQNASSAVSQSADVFERSKTNVKKMESDFLVFLNKTKDRKQLQTQLDSILKASVDLFAKDFSNKMINETEENDRKLTKTEIKRQHTDLTSEETKKTAEDFKALSSQIGFDANLLDEFFKKINDKNPDSPFNMVISFSLETLIISNFGEQMKSISDELGKVLNAMTSQIPSEKLIQNMTKPLYEKSYSEQFTSINNFYRYFYMSLMSLCLFVLFLFVLFGSGMGGICARRKHKNIKQSCHRGVSASFLMCGVSFYFLFSWIAVITAVILFVPGISIRHLVCKPLIELDNNQLFKNAIDALKIQMKQPLEGNQTSPFIPLLDLNFTRTLNQCDKKNHSDEIISKISPLMTEMVLSVMRPQFSEFIGPSLTAMNQMLGGLNKNLDGIEKSLDPAINSFSEISKNQGISSDEKMKNFINTILDYLHNNVKLIKSIKSIMLKVAKETSGSSVKSLEKELVESIFSQLNVTLDSNMQEMIKTLPSCKPISNIYKDLIVTGCFEYLDNYNTFWLTLLVTIFFFFILSCFSICQADLFRKNYPYDQITNDSQTEEPKTVYPNNNHRAYSLTKNHHLMSDTFNNLPIDAFEMENHHHRPHSTSSGKPLNRSPPPQYKEA